MLNLLDETNEFFCPLVADIFPRFIKPPQKTRMPLLELTSSSLNLPITGKQRAAMETTMTQYQLNRGVFDENFCTINIDWPKQQITLAIRSGDNKILQQQVVKIPAK